MTKTEQIKTVQELEEKTGIKVPIEQQEEMQKVIDTMPVKLTGFVLNLCKKSQAVARQFFPCIEELKNIGDEMTWTGVINTGFYGLERMYVDRCIIMPFNQCPANCRFCFRKFYSDRLARPMTKEDMDNAIEYISKDERIKEVLITGGDPLMDLARLEYLLKGLRKISHVQNIRIGSRSLMSDPQRITVELVKMLLKYHDFKNGRPIEIATHFNHPDELTPEAIGAIVKISSSSIRLYNQAVLLKGINDDGNILTDLFRKLHNHGVEIYYLFHCEPVLGISHLRTSIEKGIEIKKHLRGGFASGRINPAFCVSTKIGKVEIGVDGFIESREGGFVWIKTPYKLETYRVVDKDFILPESICRIGTDGFISIKYLDNQDQ